MSDNSKQSHDAEYVTPRHRLNSSDLPPKAADVEQMFKLSKEMKGTDIEWIWKPGARSRVFTLKANFPRLKDRDFWDYEMRDDPVWTLIDDRAHGNNLIWQQKTSDWDLVLAIVETQGQRTETQEFTVDLTHSAPLLTPLQPVFVDLISIDNAINHGHQAIHNSITGFAYKYFTGLLEISTFQNNARIYFENGVPVHATTPKNAGDMAMIETITWQLGSTSYINGERADVRTVTRPLDFLIHEGLALLEQKRFLASSGLAYESMLMRTGREPSMNAQNEDVHLKKAILDYLRRPSTLLDMLRDLELSEWQWVPALYHLLNQALVSMRAPAHERSNALKNLRLVKAGIDDRAGHFLSPKTGLYRYETLMLLLTREFRRFQLHGCPLSLVCFQIKTGEGGKLKPQWLTPEAIRLVQQRVDLLKRPADLFTHFEIMDYALLLPDTTATKAAVVAANVQQALANLVVDNEGTQLNIACGVAGLPAHGNDIETLVKTAKGAMHQAKVLETPIVVGLLPDIPTGVPDKLTSAYAPKTDRQRESITLEDLLVKSQVISKEHLENALALVKQMHTPLGRVLTMHGINVPEHVVRAAEEIQSLVEKHDLTADEAVKTLALIDNHDMAIDAAFKRLRIVRRQARHNLLAELLMQAGLISDRDLKQRTKESLSTGLPLGYLLALQEVISRPLLHDALDAIRLMRKGVLSRQEVLQVLLMVRQGQGSLRDYCESQKYATNVIDAVGTGELLVLAGLMSETDLLTAREIALLEEKDIEEAIADNGFANGEQLSHARELRIKVEKENLDPGKAAEILKGHGVNAGAVIETVEAAPPVPSQVKQTAAIDAIPPPVKSYRRPGEVTMPLHGPGAISAKPSFRARDSEPPPHRAPPEPPKEVDRVDLLRLAGLINGQQADGARKLGASTNTAPLRVLFDRGMIDQLTLNLAGIAKRKMDAGELDVKKAIAVLKHCKQHNVDFDAGMAGIEKLQ